MNQSREIKSFIFSQYFSDGLRITFGVLLPSLVFYNLNLLSTGLTISLGALCISIADNPGPVVHKRNGMLFCNLFVFLTAVLTSLVNWNPILIGIEIVALCFFFSMFSIYGNRASSVGTAALIIMILTIDENVVAHSGIWMHAIYILAGGAWYTLLSLSLTQIRPYRLAQQALGECIREVATFVRIKSEFYDLATDHDENYKKLVEQQIIVNQHQDIVRELLFKSRLMVKESTSSGRLLILVFVDIVDLFEQTMATHYDYQAIRSKFGKTDALKGFKAVILKFSEELDNLSYFIVSNDKPVRLHHYKAALDALKIDIDKVEEQNISNLVLKKILINVRNMASRVRKIYSYFDNPQLSGANIRSTEDLKKFVSHQDFDIKLLKDNLTFKSSMFRHSIRVALMCLIGYLVSKLFPFGHHSYWILLTILVILKPAFSLTKQRNVQRLIGTLCGGVAGALILIFVKDQFTLFILLMVFMVGMFSFQRLNYVVSVLFMTPYTLILFSFLGENNISIAQERIIDTFIGSFIALAASFIILPNWEYRNLRNFMREALIANYHYLVNVANELAERPFDITSYKLSRKDVFVSSANLGSAFQRMQSEPKSKQQNNKEVHKFVVLNHILSSYIATLITNLQNADKPETNESHIKLIRKSLYTLGEIIRKLGAKDFNEAELRFPEAAPDSPATKDQYLLYEQLDYINKLIQDIQKLIPN
ncbi:FUSC family protein [Daejeonella lutea]|uniref:TIGR01666 family membrane protein n=1 Tax=Daejeonella lutea TaxID=572036 RepID=A0A1T5AHI9_9SPHI|nr:FUSC family membrane protein [Daejeonella lutea]SKB34227.1 TIGR01666 family membrane protein [Daejeonella lutea]